MGAYEDARAFLPSHALAHADELIALAPPLTPAQERDLQRLLGPYCLPVAGQHPQAA